VNQKYIRVYYVLFQLFHSASIITMRVFLILSLMIGLVGCAPSNQMTNGVSSMPTMSATTSVIPSAAVEAELRNFASQWQGVPHLEGGDSRDGIDAPGLVMLISDQILGLSLPHSTARQLGFGQEIELAALLPGDLVFFRPTSMPRHVGVYLGSEEFLHSWHDGGVSIARLSEPYWRGAFWAGRRVLAMQPGEPTANTPTSEPTEPSDKRRVGW